MTRAFDGRYIVTPGDPASQAAPLHPLHPLHASRPLQPLRPLRPLQQAIPLLKSVGEAELRTIAGSLKEAEYAEGKNIIVEGDAGNSFFIIREGEVKCTKVHAASHSCYKGVAWTFNGRFTDRARMLPRRHTDRDSDRRHL